MLLGGWRLLDNNGELEPIWQQFGVLTSRLRQWTTHGRLRSGVPRQAATSSGACWTQGLTQSLGTAGGHDRRMGRSLVGTAAGLGAFTRSSLSDRVTPLIVLGRFVGPFRKPFSLSGGVWAARSRSGEDPVLLPDLPRAGRTG